MKISEMSPEQIRQLQTEIKQREEKNKTKQSPADCCSSCPDYEKCSYLEKNIQQKTI
jgi:hypothetical protein